MSISEIWQAWLEANRERFVGGDIELHEDPEGLSRGPITDIRIEDETLIITTAWMARFMGGVDGILWKYIDRGDEHDSIFDLRSDPAVISEPQPNGDRIIFGYPFCLGVFFPSGSNLDPKKVTGLP